MRPVNTIIPLLSWALVFGLVSCATVERAGPVPGPRQHPNFIIITTDDQRYDALGCAGNPVIHTPNIDALASRGMRFTNSFVTLSICSPSRAACLTGRYGSGNGVMQLGRPLNPGENTFAHYLKQAGYRTGFVGKWHIGHTTPEQCGFDWSVYFEENGPQVNRTVLAQGQPITTKGFIEDYNASQAVRFLKGQDEAPFVLWLCTQVPHMTPERNWHSRRQTLATYNESTMPVPLSWSDDLSGKPPYLMNSRNRIQGAGDTLNAPEGIQRNTKRYYAAITDLDTALGHVFDAVEELRLRDNTYVIFTSDNGWFLGEHGFTSKVLAYEESIRVPLIVAGPGLKAGTDPRLTLNIDIAPTLLDWAGLKVPADMHGRSLKALLRDRSTQWRKDFLYQAPLPQLGSQPMLMVRTERWKYIRTYSAPDLSTLVFEELYDLTVDPDEMVNLANTPESAVTRDNLAQRIEQLQAEVQR